jgi:hypothetical protein
LVEMMGKVSELMKVVEGMKKQVETGVALYGH